MTPVTATVYGLFDPRTGVLRYIGKTQGLLRRRLRSHLWWANARLEDGSFRINNHRVNWLRSLLREGIQPEIDVLQEDVSIKEISLEERWWIAYFRSLGADLTNETDGGEGTPGRAVGAETRAKIGRAHQGKIISQEHREALSKAHLGAVRPLRTKDFSLHASTAHGGRPFRDQNGQLFFTPSLAAQALGIKKDKIYHALRYGITTRDGYSFTAVSDAELSEILGAR